MDSLHSVSQHVCRYALNSYAFLHIDNSQSVCKHFPAIEILGEQNHVQRCTVALILKQLKLFHQTY